MRHGRNLLQALGPQPIQLAIPKQPATSKASWTPAMQRLPESNKQQARHQLCKGCQKATSDKQGTSYTKAARKQQATSKAPAMQRLPESQATSKAPAICKGCQKATSDKQGTSYMQRMPESNKRQARHQLCKGCQKAKRQAMCHGHQLCKGWEMAQNCTPALDNNSTQGNIFTSPFLFGFVSCSFFLFCFIFLFVCVCVHMCLCDVKQIHFWETNCVR